MTDSQLMEKYSLLQGPQSALQKLLNVQAITPKNYTSDFPYYEVITADDMRRLVRSPLPYPVPVFESNRPGAERSVSEHHREHGIGVKGIECRVGRNKASVVDATEFATVELVSFYAQCRW